MNRPQTASSPTMPATTPRVPNTPTARARLLGTIRTPSPTGPAARCWRGPILAEIGDLRYSSRFRSRPLIGRDYIRRPVRHQSVLWIFLLMIIKKSVRPSRFGPCAINSAALTPKTSARAAPDGIAVVRADPVSAPSAQGGRPEPAPGAARAAPAPGYRGARPSGSVGRVPSPDGSPTLRYSREATSRRSDRRSAVPRRSFPTIEKRGTPTLEIMGGSGGSRPKTRPRSAIMTPKTNTPGPRNEGPTPSAGYLLPTTQPTIQGLLHSCIHGPHHFPTRGCHRRSDRVGIMAQNEASPRTHPRFRACYRAMIHPRPPRSREVIGKKLQNEPISQPQLWVRWCLLGPRPRV
jgi:hypothetical protein